VSLRLLYLIFVPLCGRLVLLGRSSARLGSFAAAAEALGYTAPAVSQHVGHLENELQCELLLRGARGVQLTTPGTVLLDRAERLLAEAHVAALAVRESAGQLHSLRVGAFPSAAQRLVPDALASLRADHADLELALMHFEPPDGLTQLAAGEVDAVVSHRYPGVSWRCPTGVRTTTLASDALVLMVPDAHRLASRSRVDIAELRDDIFISGTSDDPNRVALASARGGRIHPSCSFRDSRLRGHRELGPARLRHRRSAASGLVGRHSRRGPIVLARAERRNPGAAHSARPANGENPRP
jgi:DNA-binding transcriptional LysR family regulator